MARASRGDMVCMDFGAVTQTQWMVLVAILLLGLNIGWSLYRVGGRSSHMENRSIPIGSEANERSIGSGAQLKAPKDIAGGDRN